MEIKEFMIILILVAIIPVILYIIEITIKDKKYQDKYTFDVHLAYIEPISVLEEIDKEKVVMSKLKNPDIIRKNYFLVRERSKNNDRVLFFKTDLIDYYDTVIDSEIKLCLKKDDIVLIKDTSGVLYLRLVESLENSRYLTVYYHKEKNKIFEKYDLAFMDPDSVRLYSGDFYII